MEWQPTNREIGAQRQPGGGLRALFLPFAVAFAALPAISQVLVLEGATLIDGNGGAPIERAVVVVLIDVFPGDAAASESCDVPMGGYQMHLAGEIVRGRFRNSLEHPEPMIPGEITPVHIDLKDRFHTFKAGHRIMVHVQSSWFPAYDRNPQTYVDTYRAEPEDYREATQTLSRSRLYPSHIELPVIKRQD